MAILALVNNVCLSADKGQATLLLLQDSFVAFAMADCAILLRCWKVEEVLLVLHAEVKVSD